MTASAHRHAIAVTSIVLASLGATAGAQSSATPQGAVSGHVAAAADNKWDSRRGDGGSSHKA
jgi:hypothetical protein